jgi:hypothetical protein
VTLSAVLAAIILRVAISGFLKLVMKISKTKIPCIKKTNRWISSGLYFGAFISTTVEAYLELLINAYLTLNRPLFTANGEILSLIMACLLAFLTLIFVPIITIWMIFQNKQTLVKHGIESKFGELYDGVKLDNFWQRSFRMVHILKSISFVAISQMLTDQVTIQI